MVGTMKMISQAVDPEISIKWAQDTLTLAAWALSLGSLLLKLIQRMAGKSVGA